MESNLIALLQLASSQNPNELKSAEEYLRQLQREDGFFSSLLNIYFNRSNDIQVRWQAIIYVKNNIASHWRDRSHFTAEAKCISKEEKAYIFQLIMNDFNEPVKQLGVQLAVAISRIVRLECKMEKEIILTLQNAIKSESRVVQYQALLTFYHVADMLQSMIILNSFRGEDTPVRILFKSSFEYFVSLWNSHAQAFFMLVSQNETDVNEIRSQLDLALMCTRILKSLSRNFKDILNKYETQIDVFMNLIFENARTAITCRHTLLTRNIYLEECDKFITCMTAPLLTMKNCTNVYNLKMYEFAYYYCFTDEGQNLMFERLNINLLLMLKRDHLSEEYDYDPSDSESLNEHNFFTVEKQREMCIRLITRYLVLIRTESDWEYPVARNESDESWKFCLRSCVENTFANLFHAFREVFTNTLMELVKAQCKPLNSDDLSAILLKDAIYTATGICASDLYNQICFKEWLQSTLIQELNLTGTNSKIIRKRIYWLIGQWINCRSYHDYTSILFEILEAGICKEEDMGARLTACFAFQSAIQKFILIDKGLINKSSKPVLDSMLTILKDVDDCDMKMRILSIITDMVRIVDCKSDNENLIIYLPHLWHENDDHHMLRCAIITMCTYFMECPEWRRLIYPFIMEVISTSCDMNHEGHIYYLEDGLRLWRSMLSNAQSSSPEITNLLQNMPALLDRSAENLQICLDIIVSYILLDPQEFTNGSAHAIVEALDSIITDLQSNGVSEIMKTVLLYMTACPQQSIPVLKPLLMRAFDIVYLNRRDYDSLSSKRKSCLVTARLLLSSGDAFLQMLREVAHKNEVTEDSALESVLAHWIFISEYLGPNDHKKLMSLALCALLNPSSPSVVFQRFGSIIKIIVQTLNDIDSEEIDFVLEFDIELDSDFELTKSEHEKRKDRLVQHDAILRISLKSGLQGQLEALKQTYGESQYVDLMNCVIQEIQEQLNHHMGTETADNLNTML